MNGSQRNMRDFDPLAPLLRGLRADPQARIFYDLFADALVWTDDVPARKKWMA